MTKPNLKNWFLLWLFPFIAVGIITGYLFWATELGNTLTWVELISLSVGIGIVLGLIGYLCQKVRSRRFKA